MACVSLFCYNELCSNEIRSLIPGNHVQPLNTCLSWRPYPFVFNQPVDRLGRPNTSATAGNTKAVKKMILNNRRITIREVPDNVGELLCSWQAVFMAIQAWNVLLRRFFQNIAQEVLATFNADTDLLKKVITDGELPKPNHIIGNYQKSQARNNPVNFG